MFTERTKSFVQHPVVAECCVLGLPDKDYGDAVSVIIVPDEEAKKKQKESAKPVISLEELCTWAKEKLAPYKVLQHNRFPHLCFLLTGYFG